MRIPVSGIQKGQQAIMERSDGKWVISIGDEQVGEIKDSEKFSALGLDQYHIIGVNDDEGMVVRYADLHCHSDNSLGDGKSKVSEIIAAREWSGALTDHGNMYGFLEYYLGMKKAGKKPILGFEAYMVDMDGELTRNHLILLAENNQGLKNLYKLTSEAYDHFYRKPHVTWEMLERYHDGVICLTACPSGLLSRTILNGGMELACKVMERFIGIFGKDNFFVELQRHHLPNEELIHDKLVALAKKYEVKLVVTTDSHYPDPEDKQIHEILLCIERNQLIDDPNHATYDGDGYFLHTSEDMEELFPDHPEAMDNTLEIAERCNVDIKLKDVNLPQYEIPAGFKTPFDYLEHLIRDGYTKRFGGTEQEKDPVYMERLEYEINMIRQMKFEEYFIVVWDFINYCRKSGIYVGPGRGSAAGSLAAYCLWITNVDPIKYKLFFERFLNPERVSYPDVDTDIEFSRRPEVIQYLRDKYGEQNCARIVTFGTFAAKQAVKDVGRVLGKPVSYCTKLASYIPNEPKMTLAKALEVSPEFASAYNTDGEAHELIDLAMKLEGNKRHASQHACGVALAPSAVSDFMPTTYTTDDSGAKVLTTQVVMTEVEDLSLIKMDLLGLKNMSVIREVIERVIEEYGEDEILRQIKSSKDKVDYQNIPLDDRETYQMLAKGFTGGVFQLESPGMTRLVQQLLYDIDTLPEERMGECFERIVAAVALYRPGPMDYIPAYVSGMRDPNKIKYLVSGLEEILSDTYGVIVYQEQVMRIVQKIAGYGLARADYVRKCMGKKKLKEMEMEKEVFIHGNKEAFEAGGDPKYVPGCVENGVSIETAEELWAQMADFAKYAFNRSHAVCYAYIAVITAYMAKHWPAEFYSSMLNAFICDSKKIKSYLAEAHHRNIALLPPDVNESRENFLAVSGNIRFGLQGISGVKGVARNIMEERQTNGSYKDFQDFYERLADKNAKPNKTCLEGLIYAGAFSEFGDKASLLRFYPLIEASYKSKAKIFIPGQTSLFDAPEYSHIEMPKAKPLIKSYELEKEYEALGMYLSEHPAEMLENLAVDGFTTLRTVLTLDPRRNLLTGGMIRDLRTFYTKKMKMMASFILETKYDMVNCVVFPGEYEKCFSEIAEKKVVVVGCDLAYDERNERMQLIISSVSDAQTFTPKQEPIDVFVSSKTEQESVLNFMKSNPGNARVRLVGTNGKKYLVPFGVESTLKAIDYLAGGYKA